MDYITVHNALGLREDGPAVSIKSSIISTGLEKKLLGMMGFRNIIVHQYREIDYRIVAEVINKQADDLIEFASIIVAAAMPR